MKKITTKNKVRLYGSWDSLNMEVYWHPKSDYVMYRDVGVLPRKTGLTPLYEFGKSEGMPLEIKIDEDGVAQILQSADFDIAVLKHKLESYGFKEYRFCDQPNLMYSPHIEFTSPDELAMFQVYFSDFIDRKSVV